MVMLKVRKFLNFVVYFCPLCRLSVYLVLQFKNRIVSYTVVVFVSMKDFNLSILNVGIFLQKPHAEVEVELARKIRKEAVIVFGLHWEGGNCVIVCLDILSLVLIRLEKLKEIFSPGRLIIIPRLRFDAASITRRN